MNNIDRSWSDSGLRLKIFPVIVLQIFAFLAPLLLTATLTFQSSSNYRLQWTWSIDTWTDVFTRGYYWSIFFHSLVMASSTVVVCLFLAFPVAYALATRLSRWGSQIKILLIFAFLTDTTLKTFGWVLFLDQKGAANFLFEMVGLRTHFDYILFTEAGTILGMVYNFLPFAIFTIYLSVDAIDRSLIFAAYDAGAGKFRTFWEVTLPLCRPGIWAGSALIFLLSIGAFLEPKMLGGGKSPMAAELIRQTFETRVNWPLGAALTLLLMIISLLFLFVFSKVFRISKV